MDKIKSAVTGDAYDKPAKTADGAFTTQGSSTAATTDGTSADPNSTGSAAGDKMEQGIDKGLGAGEKKEGIPDNAKVNTEVSQDISKEL